MPGSAVMRLVISATQRARITPIDFQINQRTLYLFTCPFGKPLHLQTILQYSPEDPAPSVSLLSAKWMRRSWPESPFTLRHCAKSASGGKNYEIPIDGNRFEFEYRTLYTARLLNERNENGKRLMTVGRCKGPFSITVQILIICHRFKITSTI